MLLDPIDRIDLGIARIAVTLDPFLDAAATGIVAGEGQDVGAAVVLEQAAELGGAKRGVVDQVGLHPVEVEADASALADIPSGVRRHLHQSIGLRR